MLATSVNNLGTFPYNKGVLTNNLEGTAHKIERMTCASFLFVWMNGFVVRDKKRKRYSCIFLNENEKSGHYTYEFTPFWTNFEYKF